MPNQKIAEHVITSLVNLSADGEILENLATDDKFLDWVLTLVTVCQLRPLSAHAKPSLLAAGLNLEKR